MEWKRDEFRITDTRDEQDIDLIHRFLSSTYWAKQIPKDVVQRAVEHSLCFGLYQGRDQIGFGRAITDYATFAYLSDVFVLPEYQGRGLGSWLVSCILAHPELQNLRRWTLATQDAHGLYEKHGFTPLKNPGWFLEINDPEIYQRHE